MNSPLINSGSYIPENKVGFNLLLWTAAINDSLNPLVARLKEIGYDGVEVVIGEPLASAYVDLGKFVRSQEMEITTVMVVSKEENPVDPSPVIRAKAVDRLKWGVDRAHDLGAKIICGPVHSAFATFSKNAPSDDEYKYSAEVLHQAGEYAAQAGVVFTVEAINRFECYLCNTVDQLTRLVRLADHPNVRAMFDSHHANIEEKYFDQAIRKVKDILAHVHISENDRGTPGSGHIQWDNVFGTLSEIKYRGWFTIEAFSRNDIDFANSINVWREYNEPWELATNGLSFIRDMQSKYHL